MLVGRVRVPSPPERAADGEPGRPDSLLRVGVTLLWERLAPLVALNLVGIAAAAPLIGLGLLLGFGPLVLLSAVALYPVVGGLTAVVVGDLRADPGSPAGRFFAAIRTRWRPLALLGLVGNGCLAGSLVTTARVLDQGRAAGTTTLGLWLLQSGFLVLLIAVLTYAVPLAAAYGTGARLALRNGLVLAVAAPLPSVGMVGLVVALAVSTLWLGPGMWLVAPVVVALFSAANCHREVERRRPAATGR